jgi:NAD(P)-dependent dehydrogenase (short-subunit alcohol dehydrogenase family)
MALQFDNKVALITGGVHGMGFATAKLLAQGGARVALADINGAGAEAAARALSPAKAIGIATDISKADQVAAMVERTTKELGPIDIFINSAAVLDDKLFLESTTADWERMFGVGIYGPMNCLRAVLPGMVERRYGRVICMASDAGKVGQSGHSYYAASKGAVIALIKSVAQEVAARMSPSTAWRRARWTRHCAKAATSSCAARSATRSLSGASAPSSRPTPWGAPASLKTWPASSPFW